MPNRFISQEKTSPRLVADEAVVEALLRDDGEVAMGAAVERTGPAIVGAGALELHRLADDLDEVGAVADLLDDLVGNQAHAENSTMVTPVPPWLRGAKPNRVTRRSPGDDPPHPLAHHAGAHAVNDAEERLLRQHRRVDRGERGLLGLVAGHARGGRPRRRQRRLGGAMRPAVARASGRAAASRSAGAA